MLSCRPDSSDKLVGEFLGTGPVIRNKMIKNWSVIGGIAAAIAAGVYVMWGPITVRKKRKRGMVPGLLNLGNTCFLNALLQGLAACPSFIKWLEKFSGMPTIQSCKGNQLSTTLLQLLKALSTDEPGEEDVLDAGCLLDVLRLYHWHINSFEEQDAHELFHVLTSSLEEERNRQPKVTHLFDVQSLEANKTMACRSRESFLVHPSSSVGESGKLAATTLCDSLTSHFSKRIKKKSIDLFPVCPQGRPISLDQCLQHFISSETIKEVECENCTKLQQSTTLNGQVLENQRTTFVKQLKLGKLPQCLCIHLQRLTWSSEGTPIKQQEHVQFTEFLLMDRYKHNSSSPKNRLNKCSSIAETPGNTEHHNNNKPFSNDSCSSVFLHSSGLNPHVFPSSSTEYLFQLMAVLVHHGDMHSGHFVTYRRSPSAFSSQWLWVSDNSVRKASLQEVLSSNAYMLFYERLLQNVKHQAF
uniref:Ubiquitin carboxyl-terminal hydrolase n=1 Tax=Nothobranchius furzeri TaxID=105023 RepID=A0A8C6M6A5_NOTFU